ncbi:MAG: 50S ribosomal protein L32e [Nanoarchaeota archaeon]|nr:50S ribosomal protein L32e [Nanoarchaeota archaeon]
MSKENLLKVRAMKKKKQPVFRRQEITKKKKTRNNPSWRRPKGIQSKLRLNKKGHEAKPRKGWGSPKEVRGLHKSGLNFVLVCSFNDLNNLKKEEDGVVIGSKVGKRKKLDLIKKAEEKGLQILNIRDTKAFVEKVKKEREESKKRSEERKTKAEKSKKKAKPKEAKKETKEEVNEEDKKKEDKKEKDKILTKKS